MAMVLEISQTVQMEISALNNLVMQMGMVDADVLFLQRILMVMVSLMMTIFVATQQLVRWLTLLVNGWVVLKIKRMTTVMVSQIH